MENSKDAMPEQETRMTPRVEQWMLMAANAIYDTANYRNRSGDEVTRFAELIASEYAKRESGSAGTADARTVRLGVIEFHSNSFNPGLVDEFYRVVKDLRDSASIVDLWLMDISATLEKFGYHMSITTNRPRPLPPAPEKAR